MEATNDPYKYRLRLKGGAPFFWTMHLCTLSVFFVPFAWRYVALFLAVYAFGIFGITAGFHRYFAHRGYKTGRVFQFVLAALGTLTSQKGVLWWSGWHRHHHKYSDMAEDIHSPQKGFWWSHMFWFLVPVYDQTPPAQLREFQKYPEILFLNRYWFLGPVTLAVTMFALGGLPYLVWGWLLATVALWHGTFTINSLAHVWGKRRYDTTDTSRNNLALALLTFGEGWHNNHHFYQSTANNGFFWWEVDITYYILRGLSWLGIVYDLRKPPAWVVNRSNNIAAPLPTMPKSAVRAFAAMQQLRETYVQRNHSDTFARQLIKAAAEAAQRAAKTAQKAADAAMAEAEVELTNTPQAAPPTMRAKAEAAWAQAVDWKARMTKARAELAQKAAAQATEAAEVAKATAEELKTKFAKKLADAAEQAAQGANAAAIQATQALAQLQVLKNQPISVA